MRAINQFGRFIDEKHHEKILHMVNNGYGSLVIDGTRVSYKDCLKHEGTKYIFVHIGEEEYNEEIDNGT